ncbi:hypothetical protein GEMRC1_003928 [Eukaryota sp. GEM-RC1]
MLNFLRKIRSLRNRAQVDEIKHQISWKVTCENMQRRIEVSTTHGFQGKESDVVYISTVRTWQNNKEQDLQSLGFLTDYRRLNVMLTRSRYANIIYGDLNLLKTNEMWEVLVGYYSNTSDNCDTYFNKSKLAMLTAQAARLCAFNDDELLESQLELSEKHDDDTMDDVN